MPHIIFGIPKILVSLKIIEYDSVREGNICKLAFLR